MYQLPANDTNNKENFIVYVCHFKFFHMKEISFILSLLNFTGDTLGLSRLLFKILIFTKAAKKELPPLPAPAEKNPNN